MAALAVEIPFLFFGTPSGHDVEFHLYSWLEVLSQWHHGIFYPRWAELAHFGFGEPRFIFYPPASWTLGALISAIVPWTVASSVYIWLVLTAAGSSMFMLARGWLSPRDAIFAAVLYAVNPYHLVIVYWRSAFAELLAACLVPFLLMYVIQAFEENTRPVIPLGLVLAGAWLTNAPSAVMIHYSLALLILFFAWKQKSPRMLMIGVAAVVVGACLSAFYLFPAIYEQRWVNISEAISAGSRPQDNFLFVHTGDADHDAFNRVISWIALLEMAVIFVVAATSKLWRDAKRELWIGMLVWASAISVLMFSITIHLWPILPKMQFMQFPWRWMLCLSSTFVIVLTFGVRRWWWRGVIFALSVLAIVILWHNVLPPWWDNGADLREMQDNMVTGAGYEGTDEYTPAGGDPAALDKDARRVSVEGSAHATIRVSRWDADSKSFTADLSSPDQLALRLFYYPAWNVEVNGHRVAVDKRAGTGQMLVPVATGINRVEITFARTWDRTAGTWITVVTALGLFIFVVRRRTTRA